jgi:hypothetical protein
MDWRAPRGNITTILDLVDRDAQDDAFFPYTADTSWFAPDGTARSIEFTPALQTFSYRGPAGFGQKIVVDIGERYGDFIHSLAIQVQLDSWMKRAADVARFACGDLSTGPGSSNLWKWSQFLGNCLIERAALEIGEEVIEELDTVLSHIALTTWPDTNMSKSLAQVIEADDEGRVTCLLPFWFSRIPFREAFPIVACSEGTVRLHITFRRFEDVVQRLGTGELGCDDTPLGGVGTAIVTATGETEEIPYSAVAPGFKDIAVLSYSSFLGSDVRGQYMRRPFEVLYRHIQSCIVDNPVKYAVTKSNRFTDANDIVVPLDFNGPVEEIFWVVRRKSAVAQRTLCDFSLGGAATDDPVLHTTIRINGAVVAEGTGQAMRARFAGLHRGGIAMYHKYIYGYSFARTPGEHAPSGSLNFSRAQNAELRLSLRSAGDGDNWEVHIYGVGLGWLRFERGLCGRLFSS